MWGIKVGERVGVVTSCVKRICELSPWVGSLTFPPQALAWDHRRLE